MGDADEDDDDSNGAKLDVCDAKFDPFLALYSDRVSVPRPDAITLDNVAKFELLLSKCGETPARVDELLQKTMKKKEPKPSTSQKLQQPRFQAVQGTVPRTETKRKPLKNVLTRIATASGPLSFLRDCMEKRIRVKVWTRNASGIRGYSMGYVVAFDKHWNLALKDVTEVWSRKAKRKTLPLGEEREEPLAWKEMGPMVKPPRIVIVKSEKGMETCERHVSQMLMRGEHVAFISILDV